MILRRSCLITLIIALPVFYCGGVRGQQGDQDLSAPERVYVASKIYSSIQIYFAHKSGIADLDFEAAYKSYLDKAMGTKGRREFDLATLEFVAKLRNKHTQFDDVWLRRKYGQPLGFWVLPLEGKWVVISARDNGLRRGEVARGSAGVESEGL